MSNSKLCFKCKQNTYYIDCKFTNCPKALLHDNYEGNNMDTDFDFGFSAVTEEELKQHEKKQVDTLSKQLNIVSEHSSNAQEKLTKMYNMIIPLINNLSKDPQKEYILWPGRDKKLAEFKASLDALISDD